MTTGIECPWCRKSNIYRGYGLAAGPMGAYAFCEDCDELVWFQADTQGLSEEHISRLDVMQKELEEKLALQRKKNEALGT